MRLPLAILLVVVVALIAAEVITGGSNPSRRAAPALPTQVLVAPRPTLASLKGRPAVVNFWASWCGPCRKEAPELARFGAQLHGRAQLIGVDYSDAASGARAFVKRNRWTFPNVRDASGSAGDAYGLAGLPTTFVLASDGTIAKRLVGPQTAASLQRALAAVS